MERKSIYHNYEVARECYAAFGVDTDEALKRLQEIPVSVHCWQIDDLTGFEGRSEGLTGGIAVTGNAPGRPKNREEYLVQLNRALDQIPGRTKLALHAVY